MLADGNIRLTADNAVNLIAGVNTSNETNSSKSSSSSVGVSYSPVSGFGFNAAANRSKGSGAGEGTSFTNAQVTAGNNLTITSGGDTNLIGATAAGKQVTVDVGKTFGGNLTVESLQDKSTYNESSKSSGGSISIGGGSTFGGSVSAGNTKINSNFASVNEQSKISAGDGGFTVTVAGNTTLTGGQITSTQKAVDAGLNSFTTGTRNADGSLQPGTGNVTITDINNTAVYSASGYSLTAGFSYGDAKDKDGKVIPNPDGSNKTQTTPIGSAGVGSSSGNAASITVGGISGIAGNTTVRTGDAQTGIAPIFNRDEVRADINAQITITSSFGSNAAQAWGTYSNKQLQDAIDNKDTKAIECWGAGGSCRVAGHVVIGGLAGGTSGALGAGTAAISAPIIADQLNKAGVTGTTADVLTAILTTGAGAVTGGTAGAAGALNEVQNNYLTSAQWNKFSQEYAACKAVVACQDSVINTYRQLSIQQDAAMEQACKAATSKACTDHMIAVEQGAATQQTLALNRQIPDFMYGGGGDLQVRGRLISRNTINGHLAEMNNCNNNPVRCQQAAAQLLQLAVDLSPLGNIESVAQLILGRETITQQEASRLWAAIGAVPIVGQVTRVVRNGVDITADVVRAGGRTVPLDAVVHTVVNGQEVRHFMGVQMPTNLPTPAAGWEYAPELVTRARTDAGAFAHMTGFQGEVRVASEAANRGETVIHWGDRVGTHGADVISVNPRTGEVILYDAKTYSNPRNVQPSTTFEPRSESLAFSVEQARVAINTANLPPAVRQQALANIQAGNFTTRTTAQGVGGSSPLPMRFCGNVPC